ncbi:hypothetical protein HN873_024033, partial [Arachis hypogaea]
MTDGWTDKRRRTILNFFVDSPKGTFFKSIYVSHITNTADKIFKIIDDVVEDIGEENVIEVVTDNVANYKVVREMLMKNEKKLFLDALRSTLHGFNIRRLGKKKKITTDIYARTVFITLLHIHTKGKDLVRLGMTHFATSYLTLGCLNDNK